MQVTVCEPTAHAATAAGLVAAIIAGAPGPRATVGLAGGSTPRATYREMRGLAIAWDRVDLWLSDERWVPPDHEESNGLMAAETLGPAVTLHRPRWSELLTAADAAAFYEAELRHLIPDGRADLVVLGMGTDGHTASLFPGTEALTETSRRFVANWVPQMETWRLTVTPIMITAARAVVVLVAGESKADALAEVLECPAGTHPIELLAAAEGEVTWVVDRPAASRLHRS
jgi:6-phosphogluconolactonase